MLQEGKGRGGGGASGGTKGTREVHGGARMGFGGSSHFKVRADRSLGLAAVLVLWVGC